MTDTLTPLTSVPFGFSLTGTTTGVLYPQAAVTYWSFSGAAPGVNSGDLAALSPYATLMITLSNWDKSDLGVPIAPGSSVIRSRVPGSPERAE